MIKMTEQVRRHLKDVLEDDETETGGTAFDGETLEHFLTEYYNEGCGLITMEIANGALKECGMKPIADNEEISKRFEDAWNRYLSYLKEWADSHKGLEHFGENHLSYSEWCGTQTDFAV